MPFCTKCGSKNEDDSVYCGECGSPQGAGPVSRASVTAAPAIKAAPERVRKPSFMSYVIAIFAPFIYFMSRKRWFAGIICGLVCFISIPMMFLVFGFFSYFAMSAWALWNLRYELMEVQVQQQAKAIARAMSESR